MELLVVRISLDGHGFMHSFTPNIRYKTLIEEIYCRFKLRNCDLILLGYEFTGCGKCYLDNDVDLEMVFKVAKLYNLESVEICVVMDSVYLDSKDIEIFNDGNDVVDEDVFLGLPYRSEEAKKYLSDEWCGYIESDEQCFCGGVNEFRDKLKKYAIVTGFEFIFHRNDGVRVHAKCVKHESESCQWYIKGSVDSTNGFFYINQLNNVHNCKDVIRKQKHPLLDSDVVASCIQLDILYNMSTRPRDIISRFKSTHGFDITCKVANKAKEKATEWLYGSNSESFNKLNWYRDAVMDSNPGSLFELEVDPTNKRFKRLFVAYGGCIEGFYHCLPVLYVDGTFGKSVYKGQILAATGRNGNKGMHPLAVCVCDSETEDNWNFFFRNLKLVIDRQERVVTFISDRGNGLLSAFDKIFPGNPHLFCYKHLTFNLAKRYTGRTGSVEMEKIRSSFFKLAYSSSEKQFHFNLKPLRQAGGERTIDSFLAEIPVENWCRAFFKGCRYGIMANGIAEAFNSWINVERCMPVYCMLEQTRIKQMQLISKRREESHDWTSRLTPAMEKKLGEEMKRACKFSVHDSSHGVYEVRSEFSYTVNLIERTCSCVKWKINCFPCPHALAAIQKSKEGDVYDFIDPYFHTETFKKSQSFPIHPISNVDEHCSEVTEHIILPPIAKRPPGRRRNKRFKSGGEYEKKLITCGRCHQKGDHNRLTCTEAISQ